MADNNGVLARIRDKYTDLSPSARAIANYLQQFPLTIISDSTAEIAAKTNTSKATVSRLFRQLGYASHQDAKQDVVLQRLMVCGASDKIKEVMGNVNASSAEILTYPTLLEALESAVSIIEDSGKKSPKHDGSSTLSHA